MKDEILKVCAIQSIEQAAILAYRGYTPPVLWRSDGPVLYLIRKKDWGSEIEEWLDYDVPTDDPKYLDALEHMIQATRMVLEERLGRYQKKY